MRLNTKQRVAILIIVAIIIVGLATFMFRNLDDLDKLSKNPSTFWDRPTIKVLKELSGYLGIVAAVAVAVKKFLFPKTATAESTTASTHKLLKNSVENLTRTFNSEDIVKFQIAGDPNYKSQLLAAIGDKTSKDRHVSVFGEPGVGKSFLAQEVAYHYAIEEKRRKFDVVWWIDADHLSKKNHSPEPNQNDDLLNLAQEAFGISNSNPNWLPELKSALGKVNYLLVFDNACDLDDHDLEKDILSFKKAFFPEKDDHWQKIIITSRNRKWKNGIELSRWNQHEFSSYLNANLTTESLNEIGDNPNAVYENLYNELKGLPLATSLAVAFMVEHKCIPARYLQLLGGILEYRNGVKISKAIGITYNVLEDGAKNMLNMMSFLSPTEIPVKEMIFYQQKEHAGINNERAIKAVPETIVKLKKYALITEEEDGKFYAIHRLWQDAIHEILKEQGRYEEVYANALAFLIQACKKFEGTDYGYLRAVLPHIETFASHFNANDGEILRKDLATLLQDAAKYSFNVGAVAQAMRLNAQVIAIAPNDIKLLHEVGLSNSHSLILRDHCEAAMILATKAFDYFDGVYDGEDKLKMTEKARQAIGKVKQRMGLFAAAKDNFEQSKQVIENYDLAHAQGSEVTKVKAENYSGLLHDLGSVWWEEGLDYQKSIQFFDDAIAFKLAVNGGETKNLYLNLSKMIKGVALGLLGNYDAQFSIHKEVYEFLAAEDYEQRRKAYTAYYLLNFGWDKIGWTNRSSNETAIYEAYFTTDKKTTEMLEGDVKYSIIKAVVDLRKTVREGTNAAHQHKAETYYQALFTILENKNKKTGARFLDDGTVAVSAVLDYALFLDEVQAQKTEEQITKIKAIIIFALKMLTINDESGHSIGRIVYNRNADMDWLCHKYQLSCLPILGPS